MTTITYRIEGIHCRPILDVHVQVVEGQVSNGEDLPYGHSIAPHIAPVGELERLQALGCVPGHSTH